MWSGRVVAGVVVAAALVAGCSGGDDEPTTLPSVTDTASETPSAAATTAVPTPGVITAEQAEETARQYYAAINAISAEGSGFERLSAVSAESCAACQTQLQRLQELLAGGRRILGGNLEIVETKVDSVAGASALVRVATQGPAVTVVDGSGSTVDTLPADPLSDQVLTIFSGPEGLRVTDVVALGPR